VRERVVAAALGVDPLAAPTMALGLDEPKRAENLAGCAALNSALRARDRRSKIVRCKCVFGGATVEFDRTRRISAPIEVFGDDERVGGTMCAEPFGCGAMATRAVHVRQHRVGRIANERMGDRELVLADKRSDRSADRDLGGHERVDRPRGVRRAEAGQGCNGSRPEHLSEDTRRSQRPSRIRIEPLEVRLNHGKYVTLESIGVRPRIFRQKLQGNTLARRAVVRTVDGTHPASAGESLEHEAALNDRTRHHAQHTSDER
jgi:hypothetical protein